MSQVKLVGKSLRSIKDQLIEGEVLCTQDPITWLGFVDAKSGTIVDPHNELNGQVITGKILVFPKGIGSTVGPYTLINLVEQGKAPLAILNRESDQGTVSACSIAGIPLAYQFDKDPLKHLQTGDKIRIEIQQGRCIVEKL